MNYQNCKWVRNLTHEQLSIQIKYSKTFDIILQIQGKNKKYAVYNVDKLLQLRIEREKIICISLIVV